MFLSWRISALTLITLAILACVFNLGHSHNLAYTLILSKPDYDLYVAPRTLTEPELGLDNPKRRLIAVGDIHGMNASLHNLLDTLHYDPAHDTLIALGDMLTKNTEAGSLAVLSFLAAHNASAVRGNQDQPVIRWRAWQDHITADPAGARWLADLDARFARTKLKRKEWVQQERKRGPKQWWSRVPDSWMRDMFSEHYRIARAMSADDFAYLRALPTLVHAPSLHAFFVHAGLLAFDPRLPPSARAQPLARRPRPPSRDTQEARLLRAVPQNREPWTHLHLRGISADGTLEPVYKRRQMVYWADAWTHTMARCAGFDPNSAEEDAPPTYVPPQAHMELREEASKGKNSGPLPCMPATAVYGHTAAMGLDIRRWSVGLDTGCVYGRSLSALVLDSRSISRGTDVEDKVEPPDEDLRARGVRSRWIRFGDRGRANVVSVSCRAEANS